MLRNQTGWLNQPLLKGAVAVLIYCVLSSISAEEGEAVVSEASDVAEKGVIVFYRVGKSGGAVKFHVHEMDGTPVGYLAKSGEAFAIEVSPGQHQYWSRAASRNDVIVFVEPGQTYYVKAKVKMGAAVGRPVLELVAAAKVPKKHLKIEPTVYSAGETAN